LSSMRLKEAKHSEVTNKLFGTRTWRHDEAWWKSGMKRSITDYFSRSAPAAPKQSKGQIIENKRKSNYVGYMPMKQKPTDVKLTKKRTLHCHRPALKKSGAKLPLTCLCHDNMQCSYVINFKSLMTRRGCTGSI